MTNATDLYMEEYKSLRDEAKEFSDLNFRDIQFLSTLIAALMAVMGFRQGTHESALFWSFAALQFVAFLFLLTQTSRLGYLFVLRERLRTLELCLNRAYPEAPLAWETTIVPQSLANPRSLNFQSQVALGMFEALAFAVLAYTSVKTSPPSQSMLLYCVLLLAEVLLLLYVAIRLLLHKY